MINTCKEITLIDLSNDEYLKKLVPALKQNKPILRFRFSDNLQLEFNFLDVWDLVFANCEGMAQSEYKELLNASGYIPVHQILCIADCYKCIDKSLLNSLVYDCFALNTDLELGGVAQSFC